MAARRAPLVGGLHAINSGSEIRSEASIEKTQQGRGKVRIWVVCVCVRAGAFRARCEDCRLVWLSSKQLELTSESTRLKLYVGHVWVLQLKGESEIGDVHKNAPLQYFGEMLVRSIRNRIRSREDRLICGC